PFRREVFRDGRYVALTRKQFAVLEVLMQAGGGVVGADELLERAWDESADPFTNAVRITISALRKRLGEPWLIATVPGVGYRIDVDGRDWAAGGERPAAADPQLRRLPGRGGHRPAGDRVGLPAALRPSRGASDVRRLRPRPRRPDPRLRAEGGVGVRLPAGV